MKRLLLPVALLSFAAACATPTAGEKVADTQTTAKAVEGFDGNQRLSDKVVPKHYHLALDIDPAKDTFSGLADIQVELAEKTDHVDLHGEGLTYKKVWASVGETKVGARVVEGKNGGITMVFSKPLGPGKVLLTFQYDAPLDQKPHGLYRVEDGGDWYAFTQFEPLSAREAFPSFDEPRFKTPYDLQITVPGEQKAFANTRAKRVTRHDGQRTFYFATTKPLPSYLVAFATGPLEVVKASKDAVPGVPLRAVTTKGKSKLATYALERAGVILKAEQDYFGIKFPFSKLDVVAVPNFAAGAMENVGLVTFRERLLLLDPSDATPSDRYGVQSVMAHEFAHMWFGDYVTPRWWNDIWLNEAFATWMATRTMAEIAPQLGSRIDAVRSSLGVMSGDALADARAIRQPIHDGGDVMNAFDGITYSKGRAVLQMFEAWMGKDAFRKGVSSYLKAHAYGNGTTDELLASWDKVSGKPVSETMQRFLDQPGTPLVDVSSSCKDGKTTLHIAQSRYLPWKSTAKQGKPWHVPVCVKYEVDGKAQRTCQVIDKPEQTVTLSTKSCPAFIYPNADQAGYYHWKLPGDQLVALATEHRDALTMPEKVALLPNAQALVEAHALSFGDYLKLVEAMSAETHRVIVGQVVDALYNIEEMAVDDSNRAAFTAWAKKVILPQAKRLGFAAKKGEPAEDGLLRPKVITAAADLAQDAALQKKALDVTHKYLDDPTSVPLAQVKMALPIAAWHGDKVLWKAMKAAIAKAPTPAARVATIHALGSFRNPKLAVASAGLLLTDAVRSQDAWTLVGPTLHKPETRAATWDWLRKNYDAILGKVGKKSASGFPWMGSSFCSEKRKDEVQTFFGDQSHQVPGMKRNLSQAVESIERCVRYKAYVSKDARAFLASKSPE